MQRILWGRANSVNVMKVVWLLEELGLPYRRVDLGGGFGGTDTPAYRAMNPTGRVPTLQEDEFSLWESNVILRYICAAHAPASDLWPAAATARADVDRWMEAQQTLLSRPQGILFLGLVRTPPEQRDADSIAQAIVEAGAVWSMLDAQVSRQSYVCGARMTLADIAWGAHVHRWFNLAIDRAHQPALRAWYERLLERPPYGAHVALPIT